MDQIYSAALADHKDDDGYDDDDDVSLHFRPFLLKRPLPVLPKNPLY
jgi:hypothetical protein